MKTYPFSVAAAPIAQDPAVGVGVSAPMSSAAKSTPNASSARTRNFSPVRAFTLAEVAVSMGVLAVALTVLLQATVSLAFSRQVSTERHRAATTLSRAVETLQSLGPHEAILQYGSLGVGTPFVADGLSAPITGVAHPNVEIEFFVDETEDEPSLGLPRDLDGDGEVSNSDVTQLGTDGNVVATILPVRLSLRWRSKDGATRTQVWTAVITET